MSDTTSDEGNISTNPPTPEKAPPPQSLLKRYDAQLEQFSDSLQHLIGEIVGAQSQPPRRLKSFLNGTWVGHPLHPAITDIPIGTWFVAAIFDIIWLISPATNVWAAHAALAAVIIGLIVALVVAATGFTDWSDTYGAERRVGLYHAFFNVLAVVLYLLSFILRLLQGSNQNVAAAILGFLGLISVFVAGYFGGDMVYTRGTAVNHTAWEAATGEEYEAVMPLDQMEVNKLYRVTAGGVPVVLLRQGLDVYAIAATCPHAGGPLDEGTLSGDVVQCPWHGSRFGMRDGRVLTGPATVNAPRYATRVRDGEVEVKRVTA